MADKSASGPGGNGNDDSNSFTNFGAGTMNLFGSFTNDTAHSGADTINGLGQLSANDLSGFGVDLSALEMGNSAGTAGPGSGVDLSAIQLLQLNDPQQAGTAAAAAVSTQVTSSTDDAAQMMARLLAGGALTRTNEGSVSTAAATGAGAISTDIGNLGQPGLGLSLDVPAPQPANKTGKSRASSQSSEDIGDIPLAQLAFIQPRDASTAAGASQSVPAQGVHIHDQAAQIQAMAGAGDASALALSGLGAALGIGAAAAAAAAPTTGQLPQPQSTALAGTLNLAQTANPAVGALDAGGHGDIGMSGLSAGLQQPVTGILGGVEAANIQAQLVATAAPVSAILGSADTPGDTQMKNGTSGVESTVLLSKPRPNEALNPILKFDMEQPSSSSLDESQLEMLEEIEAKLCSLLGIASKAIKMLAEPKEVSDFGEDSLGSIGNIEPIVADFMSTVAEVQAGLKYQHKRLVAQGISVQTNAAFQSDTSGPECDLLVWSDAANLLAQALESSLRLSGAKS